MKFKACVLRSNGQNSALLKVIFVSLQTAKKLVLGVDYVLHQAALGSVPRSIADPITTNETNISGFLKYAHCST